LHLESAFSITGNIRFESKSGAPAPGANVNLRSVDPVMNGGSGRLEWNKDRTAFTISDVMPGEYRLEGAGGSGFYLKSAMLGGRDISRNDVAITQSGGPIEVVMSDDGGSVDGQVEDGNGQGMAGTVMAMQEGRTPRMV